MAKTSRKPKTQKPGKLRPIFQPGQHLGNSLTAFIATDAGGGVWRFDLETGKATPVTFTGAAP